MTKFALLKGSIGNICKHCGNPMSAHEPVELTCPEQVEGSVIDEPIDETIDGTQLIEPSPINFFRIESGNGVTEITIAIPDPVDRSVLLTAMAKFLETVMPKTDEKEQAES